MKTLNLAIILSLWSVPAFAASFIQEKVRINLYYRNLIQFQVETMVPRGNYTIDVDSSLDEVRLNRFFNDQDVEVALPMAGLFSDSSAYTMRQAGASEISVDELARFVKKKTVRIGLSESVLPSMRELLKDSVIRQLGLSTKSGDVVELYDLPKEFSQSWLNWFNQGQGNSGHTDLSALWLLLAGIGALCALVGAFFFVGIRSLSQKIIQEVSRVADRVAESASAPSQSVNAEQEKAAAAKDGAVSKEESADDLRLIDKLDLGLLQLISADSLSDPRFKFVPNRLIFFWLPQAASESLDESLNDTQKPFPSPTDSVPSKGEFVHYLGTHFPKLRQLVKSEFAIQMSQYSVDHLAAFVQTLKPAESVVLMEKISPLKKQACVAKLPMSLRLEWTKVIGQAMTAEKRASVEGDILQKVKQFKYSPKFQVVEESWNSLEATLIRQSFLKTDSFADDESLFEATRNEPHLYQGVLGMVEQADSTFWDRVDLKTLSCATFGYSDSVRTAISGKLNAKRVEWYKSFTEQYSRSRPDFNHASVEAARKQLMEQLRYTNETSKAA